MDAILSAFTFNKPRTIKGDFIDYLHSGFTVFLLLIVSAVVVFMQYNNTSIICWLSTQFSDQQENYVQQFCWINNTYYYPLETDADKFPDNTKYVIHYYQFILFILAGQIMLFYLPGKLWKVIASDSVIYVEKLLSQVERNKVFDSETKKIKDEEEKKMAPICEEEEEEEINQVLNENENENDIRKDESITNEVENDNENGSTKNEPINENIETHSLLVSSSFADQFKDDFNSLKSTLNHRESSKTKSRQQRSPNNSFQDTQQEDNNYQSSRSTERLSSVTPFKKRISNIMKPIRGAENLALFYFMLKFFNLLNIIVQLALLRFIFGPEFYRYGIDFMLRFSSQKDPLFLSKQFPLITLCDYYVHQDLRQIHWNSSQCLLAINVLLEKFYVIIWFWLIILLFLTVLNILTWFIELFPSKRYGFIFKYLLIKYRIILQENESKKNHRRQPNQRRTNNHKENSRLENQLMKDVQSFYGSYLGLDGLIMMHMVKSVAGDIIYMELIYKLFEEYKKNKTH